MTSLLGRLVRTFPSLQRQKENVFTETVAQIFQMRPDVCLTWLKEANLMSSTEVEGTLREYPHVETQKRFGRIGDDAGSRLDIFIRVHRTFIGSAESSSLSPDIVMIESKIGSTEGAVKGQKTQLTKYAELLDKMEGASSKTLLYITRNFDPKDLDKIRSGKNICVKQLRWHDFYNFLQTVNKKDTSIEEVLAFMEEEGMAGTNNFSMTDLMALSGMQRALEILDTSIDEEIRGELSNLGLPVKKRKFDGRDFVQQIRSDGGYWIFAYIGNWSLGCYLGYQIGLPDSNPRAEVGFWADSEQFGQDVLAAAARQFGKLDGWQRRDLDEPGKIAEYEIRRDKSLASFLQARNHVAAVKDFFLESINQLKVELGSFKKEHPDLPWGGGNDG